jgi:hypothetical protein
MARNKDRFRGGHQDRRRLHVRKVREREEQQELENFRRTAIMAQNKTDPLPKEWQIREMRQNIEASIKDEFEKRIANLETGVAMRKAGPDYAARILAAWAALLSSALVGIVVWERFFNG